MGWKTWMGLESWARRIVDHDPIVKIPEGMDNPIQRFKASFPEGAFDAPLANWHPDQRIDYLQATCETMRKSFSSDDDWAARVGTVFALLLFNAGMDRLSVPYALEGSKEGVAQETGVLTIERSPKDSHHGLTTKDNSVDQAVAAQPDAAAPRMKVAPVWHDREGVANLLEQTLNAMLGSTTATSTEVAAGSNEEAWNRAFNVSAYTLCLVEHMSAQNMGTYDQAMEGLIQDNKDPSSERARSMLASSYLMSVLREETPLPSPTVTPRRGRPM